MLGNSNICNLVLGHAVLVCDTLHTVYLLCVKCSINVKKLPFYGCGRVSRVFAKLGKFSYSGTADVREMIWTERVENCSHKKMGKLRKKSFVCMGFHMMILQRQRKNQSVIEAVQYCLFCSGKWWSWSAEGVWLPEHGREIQTSEAQKN